MGHLVRNWIIALSLTLLTLAALLLTCLANFWCQSFSYTSNRPGVHDFQAGLWYYTGVRQNNNQIFGNNKNTDDAIFVNSHRCSAYPEGTPMDPFWQTARAFSIIATVLGFIYLILLFLTPWLFALRPTSWRSVGLSMALFMPLFQGLTLLFWRSDQCKNRSQADQYDKSKPSFLETYPGKCRWDQGSSLNCAAIVLWFITGLLIAAIPPLRQNREPVTTTETYEKHTITNPDTMAVGAAGAGAGAGAMGGAHTVEHRSDISSSTDQSHGMHHTTTGTNQTGFAPTPTTTPAATAAPTAGTGGAGHLATNPAVHPTTTNEPGTLGRAGEY